MAESTRRDIVNPLHPAAAAATPLSPAAAQASGSPAGSRGGSRERKSAQDREGRKSGGPHAVSTMVHFETSTRADDTPRSAHPAPLLSKESIASWHTLVFWGAMVLLFVPALLFFHDLLAQSDNCPVAWSCADGFTQVSLDTGVIYCRPNTVCGAGTGFYNGGCNPVTKCGTKNGYEVVTVPGQACDASLFLCFPGVNRTASECVLDFNCWEQEARTSWTGTSCTQSYVNCWTLYDMTGKLSAVIIGAFAAQAAVLAANALFLQRQNRLASVTAGQCRSHRWKATRLVHRLLDLPSYELLQFAISSLGCASYVWYSLNVTVTREFVQAWGQEAVFYRVSGGSTGTTFNWALTEVAVLFSFIYDFALRLVCQPAGHTCKFVFSFYGLVDIAAVSCVVFPNLISTQTLARTNFPYGIFFIAGPMRFLRLRRAIQGLDSARKGGDVSFGPFTLSARYAALSTLVVNIVIYILVSASIVQIFEFPCAVIEGPNNDCNPAFQKFYLTVYYIICTYSTVGYGDMYPVTDWGRMVVMVLIVVMLVQVPIQVNKLSEFFEGDSQLDDMQVKLAALDKDLRTKLGLPPPLPGPVSPVFGLGDHSADAHASDAGRAGGKALASVMDWVEHSLVYHNDADTLQRLCKAAKLPAPSSPQSAANALAATLLLGMDTYTGAVKSPGSRRRDGGITPIRRMADAIHGRGRTSGDS